MSVAALYDIHANLPALEAVLAELRHLPILQIVIGGDVLPGPMPRETLELLEKVDVPVHYLYGNGEVAVLAANDGKELTAIPEQHRAPIAWCAGQLTRSQLASLRHWPKTVLLTTPGLGPVLFCHATPDDENRIFTRLTAKQDLLPLFQSLPAVTVVCGCPKRGYLCAR